MDYIKIGGDFPDLEAEVDAYVGTVGNEVSTIIGDHEFYWSVSETFDLVDALLEALRDIQKRSK